MSFPESRVLQIAQVAHAADRVLTATTAGDAPPVWSKLPEADQARVIELVNFIIDNPLSGDSGNHNRWVAKKDTEGWKYGKDRDEAAKIDPLMVPFHILSPDLQAKDRLFVAIVKALSRV